MLLFVDKNAPLCINRTIIPNTHQNFDFICIKSWFYTSKITVMQWPAQSPNLNSIKNLQKQLDDKVHLHGIFRNGEELYQELQTAWSQIKQLQIDKLINSMPHRCTKVIKNGWYAINY